MENTSFLLIDESVLPEVYQKVIRVNQLLETGEASNTSEAVKMAGISRSVYYKYKNAVFPYTKKETGSIMTVQVVLNDKPGVLVNLLTVFYKANANILTINQNIPVKGKAFVSVSARSENMSIEIDELLKRLFEVQGVIKIDSIVGQIRVERKMEMANIAVLGHGVVGSGVLEVLTSHAASIAKRAKEEIHVKYILDLKEFPGLPYSDRFTKDFNVILNDPEVQIVVEVMGGLHPAYDFVKACLENGKSVVTSNKELVAQKGAELLAIAQANNLNFLFEASVGGGIPIIRPISQCLAANDVTEIAGILNGTTNFILTKMIREQMNFEDALKLAQQLGYAERNPSADVEGLDACRKICILASLAFGTHVYPDSVYTEGITKITLQDVDFADVWGGVIKLIGSVKKLENGQVHIMVCPMFVHRGSQLASVDDVFNGIMVRGDATGDVVFYGKGAGKLPTASAVVADVIDCVKHFKARKYLFWEDAKPNYVADFGSMETSAFVRVSAKDSDTALNTAADVFGKITPLLAKRPVQGEAGFTVENLTEKELSDKLAALEARGVKVEGRIRISDY